MPRISTISEVAEPIGSHRPSAASSAIVAVTTVPARTTGMPAAISAPKTASSRSRVIGTEVSSALRKSEFISAFPTASVLAPPASATSRPGYRACTAATAARSAATVVSAWACGPATRNVTSALRPSGETSVAPPGPSGEAMSSAARGRRASAVATARAACRICGSRANVAARLPRPPGPRAWISTLSAGGVTTPRRCRICSPCPAGPGSYWGRLCVPRTWPARKARPRNSSHPPTTAVRCRALQQAIRSTTGPPPADCCRAACGPAGLRTVSMGASGRSGTDARVRFPPSLT